MRQRPTLMTYDECNDEKIEISIFRKKKTKNEKQWEFHAFNNVMHYYNSQLIQTKTM